MALNIIAGAAGALQIAGSLSGVPYASAAATILSGITTASQQLVIHRVSSAISSGLYLISCSTANNQRKSKRIASKASQLVVALQDKASKLEGTELQQTVDEVIK